MGSHGERGCTARGARRGGARRGGALRGAHSEGVHREGVHRERRPARGCTARGALEISLEKNAKTAVVCGFIFDSVEICWISNRFLQYLPISKKYPHITSNFVSKFLNYVLVYQNCNGNVASTLPWLAVFHHSMSATFIVVPAKSISSDSYSSHI